MLRQLSTFQHPWLCSQVYLNKFFIEKTSLLGIGYGLYSYNQKRVNCYKKRNKPMTPKKSEEQPHSTLMVVVQPDAADAVSYVGVDPIGMHPDKESR